MCGRYTIHDGPWLDGSAALNEPSELYHARLPGALLVTMVSAQLNDARNKNSDLLHETGIPERVEE